MIGGVACLDHDLYFVYGERPGSNTIFSRRNIDFLFVVDRSLDLASVDLYFCRIHLNHYIRPFRTLP